MGSPIRKTAIAAAILAAAAAAPVGAVPMYTVEVLGTLGGATSVGNAINEAGEVAGWSYVSPGGAEHAFRSSATGEPVALTDLGTLGGTTSAAEGINETGQVVGRTLTTGGMYRAFRSSATGEPVALTDLGTLGGLFSNAKAINDAGQVAGSAQTANGATHAFRSSAEGEAVALSDLGTLNGTHSVGNAINEAGEVAGWAYASPGGQQHAFRSSATGEAIALTDLGTLGGAYSVGDAINASGQVAGSSQTASGQQHAFRSSATGEPVALTDLGTLGGTVSRAYGINDASRVVGYSSTGAGSGSGFVTSGDTMFDLNALIHSSDAPGFIAINQANDINNSGQIAATGYVAGVGDNVALRLTEVEQVGASIAAAGALPPGAFSHDFGAVAVGGGPFTFDFGITNLYDAIGDGTLTDLVLLSAIWSGPTSSPFSLGGFFDGMTLGGLETATFTVSYEPPTAAAEWIGELTFLTDAGIGLGLAGNSYTYTFHGSSLASQAPPGSVPEPGALGLLALGLFGLGTLRRFRKSRDRAASPQQPDVPRIAGRLSRSNKSVMKIAITALGLVILGNDPALSQNNGTSDVTYNKKDFWNGISVNEVSLTCPQDAVLAGVEIDEWAYENLRTPVKYKAYCHRSSISITNRVTLSIPRSAIWNPRPKNTATLECPDRGIFTSLRTELIAVPHGTDGFRSAGGHRASCGNVSAGAHTDVIEFEKSHFWNRNSINTLKLNCEPGSAISAFQVDLEAMLGGRTATRYSVTCRELN